MTIDGGRGGVIGETKRILVVGGAGYIGSHMVRELGLGGFEPIVLDDLSRGRRELLPDRATLIEGNLGDAALLERIFTADRFEAVMHFAAYSLVGESVKDPLAYYRNNVGATIDLLKVMMRHRVKRFIFSSTAAVYGEPERTPITEDHPKQPTNPYGASKHAVERLLSDCDAAYGLKHMSLRYFNAAGADASGEIGEWHLPETHLIPLALKVAAGKMEALRIFGTDYPTPDGTCIRDYIHVTDLARAHILALSALLSGGESRAYNLGNSRGHSVLKVIRTVEGVTGRPVRVIEAPPRPGDPAVLVAGSDRIRRELGWSPMYEDLGTIVRTAWDWHVRHPESWED
jgi:UDP-glucose 4-epimerase